jgi:hypothetical protein
VQPETSDCHYQSVLRTVQIGLQPFAMGTPIPITNSKGEWLAVLCSSPDV